MAVVFHQPGSVMAKTIVGIAQMKESFVPKKLVHTFSLLAKTPATAFHNPGDVTVIMIASIMQMKKIALQ